MVDLIDAPGTPEVAWASWSALRSWPRLDLAGCRRVVVVAPHPDDEVLGVGGTLALLVAAGTPVRVLAVTDGEASHPASQAVEPAALAGRRLSESRDALAVLGVGQAPTRLGLPDGGVADHEQLLIEELTGALAPGDWCFATWVGDGHPDHEAVGRAAGTATSRTGASLLEYPVWAWHWAHPDDPRLPWSRARVVSLPPTVRARKAAAIDRFVTQLRPLGPAPADAAILTESMVAHFRRPTEAVLA